MEDFYKILGVAYSATQLEIAQAYASRVAENAAQPQILIQLSQAFQALADPARRAEYDLARASAGPAPGAQAVDKTVPPGQLGGSQPIFAGPSPSGQPISAGTSPSGQPISAGSPTPGQPFFPGTPTPQPAGDRTVPPGQFLSSQGQQLSSPGTEISPMGAVASSLPGEPGFPGASAPSPAAPVGVGVSLGSGPERTVLVGPDDITQRTATVTCPVCGASHSPAPSDGYCQDCGFLLSQAPGEGQVVASTAVRLISADGVREFHVHDGVNSVGRQDADVLLTDATVSRLHARIYLEDGRLSVEDANSTNGSRVNGSRLESGKRTPVSEGDELQFGQVALKVRGAVKGGVQAPELPTVPEGTSQLEDKGEEVARLIALPGGAEYPIYSFPAGVGRKSDNAIVINDPYVSGRHAELVAMEGGILVRDLGSTNGTVVGSEFLASGSSAALPGGGIVQFGKQRFKFVPSTAAADPVGTDTLGTEAASAELREAPVSIEPAPASEPSILSETSGAGQASSIQEKTAQEKSAQENAPGLEEGTGEGVPPGQGSPGTQQTGTR